MELKREVARKAAFSRTDKPIPEKMIDEWEERELEKNKIVIIYFWSISNIFIYLATRIKIGYPEIKKQLSEK
jgi:hypothetical protein